MQFNYAHDYIINDLLRAELGFQQIPAGGLDMPGAREKSAEQILVEMRKNAAQLPAKTRVFDGEATTLRRLFEPGGHGTGQAQTDDAGDVLGQELEKQLFPNEAGDAAEQQRRTEAVKALAARALSLARAMGAMKGMRGLGVGGDTQTVDALRAVYRTPWEAALQRWLESVAPGERTFTRPSRRGEACIDGVLPGRRREGWLLNIVLDTSGSMSAEIPRALGAIAHFCDAVAVDQVRLVQCDTAVTADDCVDPAQLITFEVSGYGGSDLTPAMAHLAADPAVRATIVITDGDIEYVRETPPYDVLWVLPQGAGAGFSPPYGRVVWMAAA
jgi:predicted metal-dependent peptidase